MNGRADRVIVGAATGAVLLLCACARVPVASGAAQPVRPTVIVEGASIPVKLDAGIDRSGDHEVTVVGRRGDLVALTDGYASKPQGMSRC